MAKEYYVYFLESSQDGSYYIGVTDNVGRRFREHNSGQSKYTSPKKPWILKRVETYPNIKLAYEREKFLKAKKSRKIIERVINSER
ncbi:GIY-YIG nuclease family protein [Candidatus Kuenenbacteria bacterium]|nr:GIY-YIG nuclease family protein [Candidatus Kuenenbacteria bacterium]